MDCARIRMSNERSSWDPDLVAPPLYIPVNHVSRFDLQRSLCELKDGCRRCEDTDSGLCSLWFMLEGRDVLRDQDHRDSQI